MYRVKPLIESREIRDGLEGRLGDQGEMGKIIHTHTHLYTINKCVCDGAGGTCDKQLTLLHHKATYRSLKRGGGF